MPSTFANNTGEEPRYDAEALRKVTALAQQLQARDRDTLTAREIEAAGAEVGLQPHYIRRALDQMAAAAQTAQRPAVQSKQAVPTRPWGAYVAAWWSTMWMLPTILGMLLGTTRGPATSLLLMLVSLAGWAIYIGGGIILSGHAKVAQEREQAAALEQARIEAPEQRSLSRADLLHALDVLQRELEGQKQHRAFLSVDVVGSSELKLSGSELQVEYSFLRFQQWVEQLVRAQGGLVHSAAGDGMMCVFPDDAAAVRAARMLQEGIPGFNREHNRLPQPFLVRCGVSAGDVAVDEKALGQIHSPVVDRAAALQKRAAPGDILVGSSLSPAALAELGRLNVVPEPISGETAFSWKG